MNAHHTDVVAATRSDQWEAEPPREEVRLTKGEAIALRELALELVAATDQHVFWFGRVRDTAMELQRTVDEWLDEEPPD